MCVCVSKKLLSSTMSEDVSFSKGLVSPFFIVPTCRVKTPFDPGFRAGPRTVGEPGTGSGSLFLGTLQSILLLVLTLSQLN